MGILDAMTTPENPSPTVDERFLEVAQRHHERVAGIPTPDEPEPDLAIGRGDAPAAGVPNL